MIRKLAIALTIVSASYASVAQALGLGEAEVSSSLNQPLVAEIDLLSTGGLTDVEILPGLATREEFLKAGIDRVYFLSDIRFEVKPGDNGEPKIVLTTKKPVREPFLNFLVEVIWPSGRLLREYALLIDPPVYAEDKPIAATPASVAAPAPVVQSAPLPSASAPSSSTGDTVAVRSVRPQSGALSGNESYGPTGSNDTLWEIATKVRPDSGVSPQQVMLAIQDLNPNAFIDNNINKLKTGQILRLPTRDQIASRSSYQAINEVIEQNAALRKPKTKTPTSSAAATKAPVQPTTSAQADDQLKLIVPEKDSKASDSASSDPSGTSSTGTASEEELAMTLEQLDKSNLENNELTGKVDALEEQLQTLQRLLTLKNDQLANLQAQMRAGELAELEAANEELTEENIADEQTETVAIAETEVVVEDTVAIDEAVESGEQLTEVIVADTVVDTKLVDADGNVIAEKVEEQEVVVEKPVVLAPATPKPVVADEPIQEKLIQQLLSNPIYQAIVVGILVLLLAILWMVSTARAKQEAEHGADEDDFDQEELAEDKNDFDEADESVEEFAEEDSDALLDEDDSVSDEEQEDVIAEADVYIAYGRLDQAATILEDGISADPVRVDYRLKLLEVYRDSLEAEAFDKQVSELEAIQDQAALARAAEIKAELDQKLEEQGGSAPVAPVVEQEPEAELLDEDDAAHLLDEDEEQALLQGDDNNFDFDTVDESSDESSNTTGDVTSESDVDEYAEEGADEVSDEVDFESDELDVDLDIDLDLDSVAGEEKSEVEVDPGIDYEAVDLGENLEEEIKSSAEPTAQELSDLDLADDLDLDDVDLDRETEIDLSVAEDLELPELDEVDLELDSASDEVTEELSVELEAEAEAEAEVEVEGDASDDLLLDLDDDVLLDEPELDSEASADLLEVDGDDVEITDETLEQAAEALGDADDFEPELEEGEDFDFLEGTDEASTKLDLARAYIDMGDSEGAKEILLEVEGEGSPEQQQQAKDLIASLGS